jgi:hypothetical protein
MALVMGRSTSPRMKFLIFPNEIVLRVAGVTDRLPGTTWYHPELPAGSGRSSGSS